MPEAFAYLSLFGWITVGIVSLIGIIWLWKVATGNDWDDC